MPPLTSEVSDPAEMILVPFSAQLFAHKRLKHPLDEDDMSPDVGISAF